jgi:uncharacterized RDD family membrane protein YckC
MKCPKCQYISFDSGDRCRNCGYEFSLSHDAGPGDLPIQDGTEAIGPLADLSLNDPGATPNLPLFTPEGDSDAPLVTPGASPRAPLAVRRTAPVAPRPRPRREGARHQPDPEPRLALDTAEFPVVPPRERVVEPAATPAPYEPAGEDARVVASIGARLLAAAIDLAIVGGIDLVVVYFTLKICELELAQALMLPLAPLLSFLALLDFGYAATFIAAGGQTMGKMAAGIRVVPADPAAMASARVSFGHAAVRAAGYLVSALPAGLGFVPAFIGQERRALHDRLADTRVVKA